MAKKRTRLLFQILFWLGMMAAIYFLFIGFLVVEVMLNRNIFVFANISLLLFVNIYFLVPRFYHRQQYGQYFLSISLITAILILGGTSIEQKIYAEAFQKLGKIQAMAFEIMGATKGTSSTIFSLQTPALMMKIIIYMSAIMGSTVIESIYIQLQQRQLANQIRNEQLETEMKYLKNQINPHFLFNVLNNIYVLSRLKSDQTPEIVMKLSEMLRYMLYNVNQEYVPLKDEIQYIRNFIDLYNLKDDQPEQIKVAVATTAQKVQIAPMLLIPFVENAFKHGRLQDSDANWIDISIQSDQEWLLFTIANNIPERTLTQSKTGGIGLRNVCRRLELQYPNSHQLDISNDQNVFEVHLKLALQ